MLDFLRNSLKEFVFSVPKSETKISLVSVPTTWEAIPDETTLWRKALDDNETSIKGIYFHNIEDTETKIHYHKYIEHIIVLEGKLVVETAKQTFTLSPGDDLTIPANLPHFTKALAGTKQLVVWHPVLDNNLTESYPQPTITKA